MQRLRELIEDVLLSEFLQNIAIFIDEIDSIIKTKFKEDFLAFIRACYNQRVDNPEYARLTFCLLGVATPSDLIEDKNISTPFNIGRAIELTGFKLHEATPLAQGLAVKSSNPQAVLREVLAWTGGQPFLTQKVCKLILSASEPIPDGGEAVWVENLVRSRIIENWETQDEPEHLRTIRDRILWSDRKAKLLQLYRQILQQGEIKVHSIEEDTNLAGGSKVEDAIHACAEIVPDDLTSENSIDYTRLRDLLAAEQWKEADQETTTIMLTIAGQEAEGWLGEEDIEKFPCTDLLTIDQLWIKYSKGRFGFSVQKHIWQSVCGTKNADLER